MTNDIDDLLDWLDNNADGTDDAGALAHNCTKWFLALMSLKIQRDNLSERLDAHDRRLIKAEAEVARLTALVEKAYQAGRDDEYDYQHGPNAGVDVWSSPARWLAFQQREGLAPKEDKS